MDFCTTSSPAPCREACRACTIGGENSRGLFWSDRSWLVRQALQRHLLQVGYTDKLLGQLLNKLERSGLYDEALVVVVADHGVSFVPGEGPRELRRDNIADMAPLVVAVNGRIVASTRCFRGKKRFSALVPDTSFRDGFNRVELISVEDASSALRLTRIGHNDEAVEP